MNSAQVLRTVFEIVLVGFCLWAVFHEDIFVAFEQRIFSRIKRKRLKVVRGDALGQTVR